jgi:hypothetical protein
MAPMTVRWFPRVGAAVAVVGVLGLTQCTPSSSGGPSSSPTAVSPSPSTPARTLTAANLPKASELPLPIGDGSVKVYRKHARTLDAVTICAAAPISILGATTTELRSYRSLSLKGKPPFPSPLLDGQPDSYAVALQFAGPAAALQAKSTVETWMVGCRAGERLPAGARLLDMGFDWTPVGNHTGEPPVAPVAEAAEVAYRPAAAKKGSTIFESVGLTVVEDRMMITVHLFATDESPYSTNIDDDEASFAHPQIGLVQAAAKALSR